MKCLCFIFQILLLPLLSLPVKAGSEKPDQLNTLRVMSYNIRNGWGTDQVVDLRRIANVINEHRPDVVAVQEVDSMTNRYQQRDILHELADMTLMHRVYAPAISHQEGKYGVGILSRENPLSFRSIPLPGREEQRVLLIVEFERYLFACTHLSLTEEDRLASVEIIRREAAAAHKPFIIGGDLNAKPASPVIVNLQKDFAFLSDTAKHTFPASKPVNTIDYIAYYRGNDQITRLSAFVVDEPAASDHRPVIADIRFKAKAGEIFRTKPYLMNPSGGITVMWHTNVPAYSWVEYGTDTTNMQIARTIVDGQVICNDYFNKVRITGIIPGVKYYYRVCSREITLYEAYRKEFGETAATPFSSFILPPASGTDFTAVIFNDLHKQEATMNALYQQVKDILYDFVVFNGDCIDDPKNEDEAVYHIAMQCGLVGADHIPVFYLRGNHEIRNAYSIGLRNLFDYTGDKTYGAFNWGDTRFVMLDCGEDKPDTTQVYYGLNDFTQLRLDQKGFLKEELSGHDFKKATRKVLLNHIPLYGRGGSYNPSAELWQPLLAKAPFDVNISAHIHRHSYYPKKEMGNNFPVVVGGSQRIDASTVMVLQKKGKEMTLRVLNTKGEVLYDLNL